MGDVFLTVKPGFLPADTVYEDGSIVVVHNTPLSRTIHPTQSNTIRLAFSSIAIDSAGEKVITCDRAGNLVLYDLVQQSFRRVRNISLEAAHLAFSVRDGNVAYTVMPDSTVRIYNLDTGDVTSSLDGHRGDVVAIAQSSDGATLLTVSSDIALMWDSSDWSRKRSMGGTHTGIAHATIAPDAGLLVVAFRDDTIIVWDLRTFAVLAKLQLSAPEAGAGLSSINVAGDGSLLAAVATNGCCYVWDVPSQQLVRIIDPPAPATAILQVAVISSATLSVQSSLLSTLDGGADGDRERPTQRTPAPQVAMLDDAGRFLLVELGSSIITAVLELEAPAPGGDVPMPVDVNTTAPSVAKSRISAFAMSSDARLLGLLVDDGRMFIYDVPQARAFRLEALSLKVGGASEAGNALVEIMQAGAMARAEAEADETGEEILQEQGLPEGADAGQEDNFAAAAAVGNDDTSLLAQQRLPEDEQGENGVEGEEERLDLGRTAAKGSRVMMTLTSAGGGSGIRRRVPARRLPLGLQPVSPFRAPTLQPVPTPVPTPQRQRRDGFTMVDHTTMLTGIAMGGESEAGSLAAQFIAEQATTRAEFESEMGAISASSRLANEAAGRREMSHKEEFMREGDVVGIPDGTLPYNARARVPLRARAPTFATNEAADAPLYELAARAALQQSGSDVGTMPEGQEKEQASALAAAATHRRLKAVLDSKGRYPATQRAVAWKFVLRLPGNADAFNALHARGLHPAWADLQQKYPVRDGVLLLRLQSCLSCLAWWSPVLGELPFLPSLAFPLVKYYAEDELAGFEAVMTLLTCWGRQYVETLPFPPLPLLSRVHTLLCAVDAPLARHLEGCGVDPVQYAWPLLRSALSEVLERAAWEAVWDHLFTAGHDPSLLVFAVVAFLRMIRTSLLDVRADSGSDSGNRAVQSVAALVRYQTTLNASALIKSMYSLRTSVPMDCQPYPPSEPTRLSMRGLLSDPGMGPAMDERGPVEGMDQPTPSQVHEQSATGFPGVCAPLQGHDPRGMTSSRPFCGPCYPLPRGDTYPPFTCFPRYSVEHARAERERIAAAEAELLNLRAQAAEHCARTAALAVEESSCRVEREMYATAQAAQAREDAAATALLSKEAELRSEAALSERLGAVAAMEEKAQARLHLHQLQMHALAERSSAELGRIAATRDALFRARLAEEVARAAESAAYARVNGMKRDMAEEEARAVGHARERLIQTARDVEEMVQARGSRQQSFDQGVGVEEGRDGEINMSPEEKFSSSERSLRAHMPTVTSGLASALELAQGQGQAGPMSGPIGGRSGVTLATTRASARDAGIDIGSDPAPAPQPPAHSMPSPQAHPQTTHAYALEPVLPFSPPRLVPTQQLIAAAAAGVEGGGESAVAAARRGLPSLHAASAGNAASLDSATKASWRAGAALTGALIAQEADRLRAGLAENETVRVELEKAAAVRAAFNAVGSTHSGVSTASSAGTGSVFASAPTRRSALPVPAIALTHTHSYINTAGLEEPGQASPLPRNGAGTDLSSPAGRGRGPTVTASTSTATMASGVLPPRRAGGGRGPGLAFGTVQGGSMAPTPSTGSRALPAQGVGVGPGVDKEGAVQYTIDAVLTLQEEEGEAQLAQLDMPGRY